MADNQTTPGITNLDQGQTNSILGPNIFNTNTIGSIASQYKLNTPNNQAFQVTQADTPNTSDQNRNIANAVFKFNNDVLNTQTSQITNAGNRQINTITQQAADANAGQLSLFGQGFLNSQDSSRAATNLTDVTTKFTNAVYDVNSKAQDSIGQATIGFAQNNINAYNQLRQSDFQDRQQQFQEDTTNANLTGNMFSKGTQTNQRTLQGKTSDFQIAQAISKDTGRLMDSTNFGNSSFDPFAQKAEYTQAGSQMKQAIETAGLNNVDLKGKLDLLNKDSYTTDANGIVTLNPNYTQKQFDASNIGKSLQNALNLQLAQIKNAETTNYGEKGKMGLLSPSEQAAYNKSIAGQSLITGVQQQKFNLDSSKAQLDGAMGKVGAGEALAADANKKYQDLIKNKASTAEIEAARKNAFELNKTHYAPVYGTGLGSLYSQSTDSKGNVTFKLNNTPSSNGSTSTATGKYGLDLNTTFPTTGSEATLKSAQEARKGISKEILDAIQSGEAPNKINKLFVESNDGQKLLLGLNASVNGKEIGNYSWQEINLSKLDPAARDELTKQVKNGSFDDSKDDSGKIKGFSALKEVLSKYPGDVVGALQSGDPSFDTMQASWKMTTGEYSDAGSNNSFQIGDTAMNNRQLLGLLAAGGQRGGVEIANNVDMLKKPVLEGFMANFIKNYNIELSKKPNEIEASKAAWTQIQNDPNPAIKGVANTMIAYKNSIADSNNIFTSIKPLFDATTGRGLADDEFSKIIKGLQSL